MLDVYIVYDNEADLKLLEDNTTGFIHSFDMNYYSDKKKGYKLKGAWGAKLNPFILVEKDGHPIKCYYTESGTNAVKLYIDESKNL